RGSNSKSTAAVSSKGEGGGFLAFGTSTANADPLSTTAWTTVNSGAKLFASRDAKLYSKGFVAGNGESISATGGLVGSADTNVTLQMNFNVKTTMNGELTVNRSALLDAGAGFNGNAYARSDSGGLGADADANDDDNQGVRVGESGGRALAQTQVGGHILAGILVYMSAGVGIAHDLDSNGNVTDVAINSQGLARSNVHAAALGADS